MLQYIITIVTIATTYRAIASIVCILAANTKIQKIFYIMTNPTTNVGFVNFASINKRQFYPSFSNVPFTLDMYGNAAKGRLQAIVRMSALVASGRLA